MNENFIHKVDSIIYHITRAKCFAETCTKFCINEQHLGIHILNNNYSIFETLRKCTGMRFDSTHEQDTPAR